MLVKLNKTRSFDLCCFLAQMRDIADMAIQVGGAREGQSFDLKI
jgi:hypothetical protein